MRSETEQFLSESVLVPPLCLLQIDTLKGRLVFDLLQRVLPTDL